MEISAKVLVHRVSRLASRVSILSLVILVASCTTPKRKIEAPSRDPSSLSSWSASGRMAVSGAESGGSGSFNWSQRDDHSTVQMRGPVGVGSLKITIAENRMSIATGDGAEFEAQAAEEELANRLGAVVPARNLRYWIVGTAAPGEHQWSQGATNATLTQSDWRIDYQKFEVTDGVRLPTRLVATSGPARVRIVVDKWKVQ